jgi:hypothetical protein
LIRSFNEKIQVESRAKMNPFNQKSTDRGIGFITGVFTTLLTFLPAVAHPTHWDVCGVSWLAGLLWFPIMWLVRSTILDYIFYHKHHPEQHPLLARYMVPVAMTQKDMEMGKADHKEECQCAFHARIQLRWNLIVKTFITIKCLIFPVLFNVVAYNLINERFDEMWYVWYFHGLIFPPCVAGSAYLAFF